MGIILGLLAASAGFFTTVALLNIIAARIGLTAFNPSYQPGVEARYPNLVLGAAIGLLGIFGWVAAASGLLSWYLWGVATMPIMMFFAWLYFTFVERD